MENCSMVLKQMKYTADLNSLVTLERIVRLLPQSMQAQWGDLVDKLTEDDREPTFDELTQFVASRTRVASCRFGRLANRSRKGHNIKTNCHLQSGQWDSSTVRTKCSVCSDDYAVYKYPEFRKRIVNHISKVQTLGEPSEFQVTSHPYGVTSSPFCADFAMNNTAQTFSDGYDRYVVDAVKNNFYVDDCMISFSTCDPAKEFVKQIIELLRRGGFKLKKWITNLEKVRTILPDVCKEESLIEMSTSYDTAHRTLGVE
ncbi:hypothetical protein MS3_00000735 [Schistosoma haematobium]|uniref:Reverse transcriptase domain-containing protein n=1 Tax=Schistosoma haematobium TaxID=6185 RepID=A0A922IKK2_SCHHA|nr:hypothetical protein MS3_00000735 [Schistosoma haematobium]KAH9580808.1 hypothetical protein MS3_00000735 [Schistosoma haematobium]